ncbi:proteasome subunit alpha [Paractinoplanes brasiliensis]|uniref:Proteasome subunit alpha n=1 Tax=Paractinoplanes brasiliensis TaxID=52695 RepID=A0A4R6J708_9ACTN|nr:proteasome subunit alpha [Actinoplanes brasiliensis]TDO31279.1 proteasome alpha subunit [Actinoplanes brasiliensis]GID28402.1 proteasome subunit alpha [Actinoplanes brasiliensis]
MAMQFYASPEQVQRDRSEYARKGIARGRSAVVLTYEGGILLVAENITTLRKISEIYDKIGFAAVGRYNEFESLRRAGIRMADVNGYSYDRRDVTGRFLANAFTQTLGAIFTETQKPYEVEICIAQVGSSPETDELYRITYDGSVMDEPGFMAMGGQAEAISNVLRERHDATADLKTALHLAAEALGSVGGENGQTRSLDSKQLEVAVLDRRRKGRAFRRIHGASLVTLLKGEQDVPEGDLGDVDAAPPQQATEKPTVSAAAEEQPAKAPEGDPAEPSDGVNGDGS